MTAWASNWEQSQLADLLVASFDGAWGEDVGASGRPTPVLRSTDMRGGKLSFNSVAVRGIPEAVIAKKKLHSGDVLVTKASGSAHLVGASVIFFAPDSKDYLCSNFTRCLRPNTSKVDPEYLHYAMLSKQFRIQAFGAQRTTSGLRNLKIEEFQASSIGYPSLSEQRRIVARIKECMERVEEIEELKNSSRIQQQYLSASLIESELHPDLTGIEGWTKLTVGELVTTVRNGRSIAQDTEGLADGGVLTLTAVRSIDLGIDYRKPIALPNEVATQFGIDAGDVFVSRANTIELVGLSAVAMEAPTGRLIYPDLLIKLKANPALILPRYLAYALRSASSRKQIKARALGSSQTMVKISGERLREVSIPVPSLAEQAKIISRLDAAHDLMRQLATESLPGEVEVLRGAILRKAFAGEL